MLVSALKKIVGKKTRRFAVPEGRRVYAVGDIHGRRDLLDRLIDLVEQDDEARGHSDTLLIFLGDLVDRGPDSRGVVDRLLALRRARPETRFLMGNHEEVFLRAHSGDLKALRLFVRIGGKETLLSYGISEEEYRSLDFPALMEAMQARVPQDHVDFLSSFEELIELGDYVFVHAGIRPGVALDEQKPSDMRWIRDEFLSHRDCHGKLVVHGHSISEEVEVRSNRIGIDTGAYSTGRLTAIGIEGADRWFVST